jgi:hypothetical protein
MRHQQPFAQVGSPTGPKKPAASQAEGSGAVATVPPWWLALFDGTDSVAEAGGGAARHTRA